MRVLVLVYGAPAEPNKCSVCLEVIDVGAGRPPYRMASCDCRQPSTCSQCSPGLLDGRCPLCRQVFDEQRAQAHAAANHVDPELTADALAAEEEESEEAGLGGSDDDTSADDNEGSIEGDGPGTRVKCKME